MSVSHRCQVCNQWLVGPHRCHVDGVEVDELGGENIPRSSLALLRYSTTSLIKAALTNVSRHSDGMPGESVPAVKFALMSALAAMGCRENQMLLEPRDVLEAKGVIGPPGAPTERE